MKWFLVSSSSDEQAEMLQQWLRAQDFPQEEPLEEDPRPKAKRKVRHLALGAMVAVVLLAGFSFWQMNEAEYLMERNRVLQQQLMKQSQVQENLQDSLLRLEVEVIELRREQGTATNSETVPEE